MKVYISKYSHSAVQKEYAGLSLHKEVLQAPSRIVCCSGQMTSFFFSHLEMRVKHA